MITNFDKHINESLGKKYGLDVEEKTILFTDIKGSSDLWSGSEDKMFKALDIHEKQMEKLTDKYNGVIIKSIGDSYMIAFDTLEEGVDMATELQEDLKSKPIKVGSKKIELRIGICGGDVYKKETTRQGKSMTDYFGNVVNTASRMESKVSEVGGIAFAYIGKNEKLELDDYKVDAIAFNEDCRVDKRSRSSRLLTDTHNFVCKNVSTLKGVEEVIAYKFKV